MSQEIDSRACQKWLPRRQQHQLPQQTSTHAEYAKGRQNMQRRGREMDQFLVSTPVLVTFLSPDELINISHDVYAGCVAKILTASIIAHAEAGNPLPPAD